MPSAPVTIWVYAVALIGAIGLLTYAVTARRPVTTAKQLLSESSVSFRELSLRHSALERLAASIVNKLRDLGSSVTPVGVLTETERRIARAGLSTKWTADRLIAVKAMGSIAIFLVLFLAAVTTGTPLVVLFAAAIAVFMFFVPDLLLVRKGDRRDLEIRDQLADVADQILIAVEAGAALDSALERVTRNAEGALQFEFRRMLQDVSFGLSRKEALTAMVGRTEVSDLREMLLALAQSEEHGLSVGAILRVQAAEIRDKRRARAEERAMKVPVQIVFPLVLCILPCLLAIIGGPAVVRIVQNLNL